MSERWKTAQEVMEELKNDPDYQARRAEKRRQIEQRIAEFRVASQPVVQDLAAAGVIVDSLSDLRSKNAGYQAAVPVLTKWLPVVTDSDVKEAIVRALSVPFAKSAAPVLVREFERSPLGEKSLKWAIGSALEVLKNDSVEPDIVRLLQDKKHGKTREMLAMALGRSRNPEVIEALIGMLEDVDVRAHVIAALGQLRASAARGPIEKYLDDPVPRVRNEAKRALKRIPPR